MRKARKSPGLLRGVAVLLLLGASTLAAGAARAADKDEAQGIVGKAKGTLDGFMREGGTGVFLARDEKAEWSRPAFHTMG